MIAIPNMSKPKNCMDCIVEEYADCDICKGLVSASKYADRRYEHCTLIEIDDELISKFAEAYLEREAEDGNIHT